VPQRLTLADIYNPVLSMELGSLVATKGKKATLKLAPTSFCGLIEF
jgi:hypothetical protein